MLGQLLSLGVGAGDLRLDLDLRVGQPASDPLHEDQIKHVALEPASSQRIQYSQRIHSIL